MPLNSGKRAQIRIPSSCYCALALWLSCAATYAAAQQHPVCDYTAIIAFAPFAVCLQIATMRRDGRFVLVLVASSVAVGVILGSAQASKTSSDYEEACNSDKSYEVKARLLADSVMSGDDRSWAPAEVNIEGETMRCRLFFNDAESRYIGEEYDAKLKIKPADPRDDAYSWYQGIVCTANVVECNLRPRDDFMQGVLNLRRTTVERIAGNGDGSDLLAAMVCGWRAGIRESGTYDSFRRCGIAHIVAVSGAHLAVVASLIAAVCRITRIPRRISSALTIALVGVYFIFSGMAISALRAAMMVTLALGAIYGKRRSYSLHGLAVSIIAIVSVTPLASVSLSFALSVLSTFSIILFANKIDSALADVPVIGVKPIRQSIALTVSASAPVLPLSACVFGAISIVGVFANVLIGSLFAPACIMGMLAATSSLIPLPLSACFMAVSCWLCALMEWLAESVSSIPHAYMAAYIDASTTGVILAIAFATLLMAKSRIELLGAAHVSIALVALSSLPFWIAHSVDDAVIMLDVGQGDAFLVRSEGKTLLIDTGPDEDAIVDALEAFHVSRLDGVLISHKDADHCGALDAVGKAVPIDKVLLASPIETSTDSECAQLVDMAASVSNELVYLNCGDTFGVGKFSFQMVWPFEFSDAGGNADSLCVYGAFDVQGDGNPEETLLFLGDAESDELASILDNAAIGHIDVLKVGHHGSATSITHAQVKRLSPHIALIGVGANNKYGHPTHEALEALASASVSVFRSDVHGDVSCKLGTGVIDVRAYG